jgi:hypothetical protein
MSDRIYFENLVGAVVRDESGRKLGRIYEMVTEERDNELVIVEFHVGLGAFLEQVSTSIRNMFGMKQKEPLRISWERLDLSDPKRPTARQAPSSRS